MKEREAIIEIILGHYPETEGIYLFGSYATDSAWPCSDVDIALLLPHRKAQGQPSLMLTPCHCALADVLGRTVDLINAREVSTVLQKEIIATGLLLYRGDDEAVGEFEALVLSLYQKLNDERAAILEAFEKTGRAYAV